MNRKIMFSIGSILIVSIFSFNTFAASINNISIVFKGDTLDNKVIAEGSDVYVSLDVLTELGYEIRWKSDEVELVEKGQNSNGTVTGVNLTITDETGIYTGALLNGLRNGMGTQAFKSGDVYVGAFKDDMITGNGTYYYDAGGIYEGSFINGIKVGIGKRLYIDKREYYGEWDNGLWNGYGKYIDENGKKIFAVWENGRMIQRVSEKQFDNYFD